MSNFNVNDGNGVSASAIEKFLASRGEEKVNQDGKLDADEASLWDKLKSTVTAKEAEEFGFPDLDLGHTSAQRRAAGASTTSEPDATFIFYNNIDIRMNIDVDVKGAVDEYLKNLDFTALMKKIDENQDRLEQFLVALFNGYADKADADLSDIKKILIDILTKLGMTNDKVDKVDETLNKLLLQQMDVFKVMGVKLDKLIELCTDNNKMQQEQNITLGEQNEILKAIYDLLSKFNDRQTEQFNQVIDLLEQGNVDIHQVLTFAKAIYEKQDEQDVNFDRVIKEMQAQGKATREAINNLDIDVRAGFEEVAAQIVVNGGKLDDIKELLIAMKQDIGEIKADTKESKEIQKEILAAIKALGADSAANFTALLNAVNEGNVKLESLKGILTTIKNYTAHIDGDLHDMKADQKLILEGVNIIIEKIGKGEPSPVDPQGPDYTEILNLIYDKLSALKEGNHNDLMAILSMLGNRPDIDLTELYNVINNKGDEIIAAIKDHDVHVTIDPADIKVNVECHCTHGQEGKNEGIIDAEGLIDAGVSESEANAVFDFTQVLSAKRRAIAVDDFNTTAIENVQEQQKGPKVIYDLSGRRIAQEDMQKGQVYILDGRKVLYK